MCPACGYRTAAPHHRCPDCGGALAPAAFSGGGQVWSWTVVHPPGAEPYGLAHIDLDDGGPRLLARFDRIVPLRCGSRVLVHEVDGLPVVNPDGEQ